MIDIYNIKLVDILPPNLRQDPDVIAAAEAIDDEFLLIVNEVKQCIILPRIDELDSDLIDLLSYEMHVDFYDPTLPLETRRQLVKNSFRWHEIKGSAAVVEDIITHIFGKAKLKEWFEYNGQPYCFRIDIEATEQGVTKKNLTKVENLINKYKNTRSWLEVINIFLTSRGSFYIGCCLTSGEEITVYPYSPKEIDSKGKVYIAAGNNTGLENVTVYPKGGI